jgi:hypothetical protein
MFFTFSLLCLFDNKRLPSYTQKLCEVFMKCFGIAYSLFLGIFLTLSPLYAKDLSLLDLELEANEQTCLQQLIQQTEQQLVLYRQLLQQLQELTAKEKALAKNPKSQEAAQAVIFLARDILQTIESEEIDALFPIPYLEKLQKFAAIARKQSTALQRP